MQSAHKTKFLEAWHQPPDNEQGFTLIELLVVIIIISILAAIALPAFLSQANKAKQSEAKTYIGSLNKGQQAYYVEKSAFTGAVVDLGVGIRTQTNNYTYITTPINTGIDATAFSESQLVQSSSSLKAYAGLVSLQVSGASSDITSVSVLCQENQPGAAANQPLDGQTCNGSQTAL